MIQRTLRFIEKEPILLGPLSLLCTVAIGVKTAIPFDLLFLAAAGLFLSARYRMRGCAYSLILLGVSAVVKHAFITTDHLWELGLEGSLASAFFLIAFAFEQGASSLESLEAELETGKKALSNLEEELAKAEERGQEQQLAYQEKVSTLQKELEELETDHSSILILNEVLRKTTARHTQENEALSVRLFEIQRDKGFLKEELISLEEEMARLKNSDPILVENRERIKELNQARFDREQMRLMMETLSRLHVKEVLKAREADEEAASLADQLAAAKREAQKVAEPLVKQIETYRKEIDTLSFQFERANSEANQARTLLLHQGQIQAERNFLKERLESAQEEIALLQSRRPQVDPQIAEQLAFAQEKIGELAQIEPLYKQLKKQFEEKNQVLHQARSDLFKVDTELQRVKIEKAALELNPVPKEVEQELEALTRQITLLEEENSDLQELVSLLSDPSNDALKRKKKVKMQPNLDQEWLF